MAIVLESWTKPAHKNPTLLDFANCYQSILWKIVCFQHYILHVAVSCFFVAEVKQRNAKILPNQFTLF